MRRVQSLDYTAANLLHQIETQLYERGGKLILTTVPDSLISGLSIRSYMKELGFDEKEDQAKFFPELDSALEWIEEEILRNEMPERLMYGKELSLSEIEFFDGISKKHIDVLLKSMKEKKFSAGESIFKQSDLGDEIFFIRKGEIKIILPLACGSVHHLASFSQGDFFGDMSFLDKKKRSANAFASADSSLYILSRKDFEALAALEPEVASVIYERLAYMLALRLRRTNREVTALQDA